MIASNADFLHFPKNADVVSHPVKLWKTGRAREFPYLGLHREHSCDNM